MWRGSRCGTELLYSLLQSLRGHTKLLSSGCVRGGVGECQLVPAVFNFFSGAERGKHLWEETAESREDKVPFLLPPACCALAVWIQVPTLA